MKKLLILSLLFSVGCNKLHHLIGTDTTPPKAPGDVIVLDSTSQTNHDAISVNCFDRFVTVRIKVNNVWKSLNNLEYKVLTDGPGGGSVIFENEVYPTYNVDGQLINLFITGLPAVPIGTEYEIKSVVKHLVQED